MPPDDDDSTLPPDFDELSDDILDESNIAPDEPRATPIEMIALFFAFMKEVMPELLERFQHDSKHGGQAAMATSDQRAAVLRQEAIIESEQFISNAIIRVREDYHAILVDGQLVTLDTKQRIIFRALVERHREGDYSFITAAQLTDTIAKRYPARRWANLETDNVVVAYSRLRRDICSGASTAIIEHNGRNGIQSGYRLSVPPDNILLPKSEQAENR